MLAGKIKQPKESVEVDEPAEIKTIPTVSRSFVHANRRIIVAVVCLVAAVVCVGGWGWWLAHRNASGEGRKADAAEQAVLQQSLTTDLSRSENQSVIDDTSKLIAGKQSGKYTFNNKSLAEYYMYAGTAYMNLKEYSKATANFKAAPKYDATEKRAALQGELAAGYAAGARQQLIPVLQQLAAMSQNSDGLSPPAAYYRYAIQQLQQNQQVDL